MCGRVCVCVGVCVCGRAHNYMYVAIVPLHLSILFLKEVFFTI